jgi:hypothetical protein
MPDEADKAYSQYGYRPVRRVRHRPVRVVRRAVRRVYVRRPVRVLRFY